MNICYWARCHQLGPGPANCVAAALYASHHGSPSTERSWLSFNYQTIISRIFKERNGRFLCRVFLKMLTKSNHHEIFKVLNPTILFSEYEIETTYIEKKVSEQCLNLTN